MSPSYLGRLLVEVVRVEDLEVVREDGHEAAALGREARQHAAEVEAQRVILGRVDEPHAADDDLVPNLLDKKFTFGTFKI